MIASPAFRVIAPLDRVDHRRGAAGLDQSVGSLEIAFFPHLERQLHVGELALLNREVPLRFGLLLRLTGFLRVFVCGLTLFHESCGLRLFLPEELTSGKAPLSPATPDPAATGLSALGSK